MSAYSTHVAAANALASSQAQVAVRIPKSRQNAAVVLHAVGRPGLHITYADPGGNRIYDWADGIITRRPDGSVSEGSYQLYGPLQMFIAGAISPTTWTLSSGAYLIVFPDANDLTRWWSVDLAWSILGFTLLGLPVVAIVALLDRAYGSAWKSLMSEIEEDAPGMRPQRMLLALSWLLPLTPVCYALCAVPREWGMVAWVPFVFVFGSFARSIRWAMLPGSEQTREKVGPDPIIGVRSPSSEAKFWGLPR